MWMEEHDGERINNMRTDQAIATHADNIAVACPFCLTMMTDGLKARGAEEKITSIDVAEVAWKAMGLEEEKQQVDVCTPTG
jgi:Fe-S oxidoreductase